MLIFLINMLSVVADMDELNKGKLMNAFHFIFFVIFRIFHLHLITPTPVKNILSYI